jgi:hypothetical protein
MEMGGKTVKGFAIGLILVFLLSVSVGMASALSDSGAVIGNIIKR